MSTEPSSVFLNWVPKVVWIRQRNCKFRPHGSGSSPLGPTNKKRGITSPLFFDLVVSNYFFLEIIDHTPPVSVTAAPISSCTDESVARPFIIRIPPTKVSACLTIPRICSLVILMLIKGLCQSINIGEIGKLSFGLMAGHVVLVHAVEVRILQGQQGVRWKPKSR